MGIIRFLLAISVLLAHSQIEYNTMLGGQIAVQLFFIISGFYIALILNEKYSKYKDFITNRVLKIYPLYIFILLITIILGFIKYKIDGVGTFANWNNLLIEHDYLTILYKGLINIILLGQDINWLLTENISIDRRFIFITQAWTLGTEMLFYIIAFFIVKLNKSKLLILTLIILIARFIIYINKDISLIWLDKFFPLLLIYFILGIFSYKIYKYFNSNTYKYNNIIGKYGFILVSIIIIFFNIINFPLFENIFYIIFTILIPFIFIWSKYNKKDRLIGELSYPIYIVHVLIIYLTLYGYTLLNINKDSYIYVLLTITIVISYLLYIIIIKPIDNYRQKRLIK